MQCSYIMWKWVLLNMNMSNKVYAQQKRVMCALLTVFLLFVCLSFLFAESVVAQIQYMYTESTSFITQM